MSTTKPTGDPQPSNNCAHSSAKIELVSTTWLTPYARNARVHSKKQVKQIAASITEFGFTNPILVTDDDRIVAGHGRVEAAKLLGIEKVPIIRLSHLTPTQQRAYVIADNRLAETAGWDKEMLAIEFQELLDLDFDLEITGFELAQIDVIISEADESDPEQDTVPEDRSPAPRPAAVTRLGDVWICGRHRVLCGDARNKISYDALMTGQADMILTDPPYNVDVDSISNLGKAQHGNFAMGSGEMSDQAFTAFLTETLGLAAKVCRNGAIAMAFMDWRQIDKLIAAGKQVFSEMKNLIVWDKGVGGMGTFYRSAHELCAVFKYGDEAHTNTFGLGQTGRYRTNVWRYRGMNSFGEGRMDELALHPTVKPVAMLEDAIKDVTRRKEIVLDPFGGSGSTLIAAEKCGRAARLIEIDPVYCDVIVRRWQTYTGKAAVREADQISFEDAELFVPAAAQEAGE